MSVMGFSIEKAQDEGYFVSAAFGSMVSRHEEVRVRCAGSLNTCLEYIKRKFDEAADAAQDELMTDGD
jgi:hypothetical protein